MSSLRALIDAQCSKATPRMSQPHFIALWRTLHDILNNAQPEDQQMYHAIASIGEFLLQALLDWVFLQFYQKRELLNLHLPVIILKCHQCLLW